MVRSPRTLCNFSHGSNCPSEIITKFLFGICCTGFLPGGSDGKDACNTGYPGSIPGFNPWVGKIPWRRTWQPTPVFLPVEFHRQRSLVGYSPWGCKESDTTERLSLHFISVHFRGCRRTLSVLAPSTVSWAW